MAKIEVHLGSRLGKWRVSGWEYRGCEASGSHG